MRGGLRRAWMLGAIRRPWRGLVVVGTLAAMTVGTVAALVAADSLESLFFADARAEWGEVDVVVSSGHGPFLPEGLARHLGDELHGVDGVHVEAALPRLVLPGVAHTLRTREPGVQVVGVGPEEGQADVPLRAIAGASAPWDLGLGEVILNERLASRLGVGVGDQLTLAVGVPGHRIEVPALADPQVRDPELVAVSGTVAGIVADEGLADLRRRPTVLLRRAALQEATALTGDVTGLHLAVAGDASSGDRVVRALEPTLRRLGLVADTVSADALEIADDEAGQFRSILLMLAAVVMAAAAVAAVQLLTALAQDRSPEIGQLRAHGVSAGTVRRLLAAEAAVYAVLGGAIGVAVSLPLASVLAHGLADHFADLAAGRGREQVALAPVVEPVTVVVGVLVVVAAAALAGRAAGRRVTAVDVDELLRGPLDRLPEVPLRNRRTVAVALLGSLLLGAGLGGGVASDALRYLGVTLLLTAAWMHLRRQAADGRARYRLDRRCAWAALVWATGGAAVLADFRQGYETGFGTLFVAGVVSVVAVTVLLSGRFRGVMRVLRAYVPHGRWQAVLRTAAAHAETATGRTARLHATFGVVLFAAASLQVLGSAQAIDPVRQGGGFDVIGTSVVDVRAAGVAEVPGVERSWTLRSGYVPEDRYGVEDADGEVQRVRYPVRLLGITPEVATTNAFSLLEHDPDLDSAREVLSAVARDGDKVVIDRYARPAGVSIGDDVVIDLGLGPRHYRLVGVVDSFLLGAVLVAEDELPHLVPAASGSLVLAEAAPAIPPAALAERLEAFGRDGGLTVRTVPEAAEDLVAVNRTFTDVFALVLLVGLAVALLAVAAMLVRAAREHRVELALLWAYGLRRRHLVGVLAAEPIVVAGTGAIAGLGVGLAVLRVLFWAGFADLPFVVDMTRVTLVLGLTLGSLVLTCLGVALAVVPRLRTLRPALARAR